MQRPSRASRHATPRPMTDATRIRLAWRSSTECHFDARPVVHVLSPGAFADDARSLPKLLRLVRPSIAGVCFNAPKPRRYREGERAGALRACRERAAAALPYARYRHEPRQRHRHRGTGERVPTGDCQWRWRGARVLRSRETRSSRHGEGQPSKWARPPARRSDRRGTRRRCVSSGHLDPRPGVHHAAGNRSSADSPHPAINPVCIPNRSRPPFDRRRRCGADLRGA
jgi:hypothetical protein